MRSELICCCVQCIVSVQWQCTVVQWQYTVNTTVYSGSGSSTTCTVLEIFHQLSHWIENAAQWVLFTRGRSCQVSKLLQNWPRCKSFQISNQHWLKVHARKLICGIQNVCESGGHGQDDIAFNTEKYSFFRHAGLIKHFSNFPTQFWLNEGLT